MKLSNEEIDVVMSEFEAHGKLPIGHSDCEFCDWAKEFTKSDAGQELAEATGGYKDYVGRLFCLYCGIKIGRSQGVSDLLAEYEEKGKEDDAGH